VPELYPALPFKSQLWGKKQHFPKHLPGHLHSHYTTLFSFISKLGGMELAEAKVVDKAIVVTTAAGTLPEFTGKLTRVNLKNVIERVSTLDFD
ncbi:hypothetical protein Tco_1379732, partial [Tanacetum coccineum]